MRAVSCLTRFLYRSDFCYLFKFISISEIGLVLVGALLAICSGAGLPHLVEIVGWMLNQYIFLETGEFRAKYIPLLTYFCTMAVLLAIIAFFQHICFRMSAIKIGRRLRRRYFRNVLFQELCFFDDENFDSKEFDSAVRSLQTAIGDSLPNIILTIAQVAVAMIVSFTLAWRLAGVVAIIAFGCCIWTMILNKLIALATASLNAQNARLAKCIDDEINFVRVLNSQRWRGTLKGFLEGLLVGSTQFFPYIAWAVGAFYGNWLLDNNLMNKPTYIFVCASSLMPAWIRFAALPGHLTTLFGIAKVSRLLKKAQANPHKRESFSLNDETQAELEKRQKDVLIKLIKSEIGELPEPHYHHKSAAFSQVRRKALSHYILGPIAFLCCAMVGASAAVISVLNGRMFSMYKYENTYPYYERGIQWGIKYFILGGTVFITGIISGTLYGWISENAIRKIRYSAMQCCHSKLLEKQALVDILTKYTAPIKAAFDNRQSAFLIGIMSIICAVLSNIPKNIIICALCAVTFGVQTISQFFVFRFADICTKHAQRASIKKGLELIDQLEEIPTEAIGDSYREISKAHSRYLSFVLNKEGPAMLAQSLRFSFTLAVPQITQAFSYAIGGYFIADDYIAPFDVYSRIEEGGQFFVQRASPTPTTRLDLIALQEKFEAILANARAKPFGICPIRRRIYDDLFDELIRQVTVSCAERGLLLLRVRDEIRLTLLAYQGVLESAIAYGIRKAVAVERHQTNAIVERDAEKQKNVQLSAKIEQLNKQISTERLVKEEEVKLLERSMRDENERLLESNRTLKMHLQSIIQMDQQNGPQPSEIND